MISHRHVRNFLITSVLISFALGCGRRTKVESKPAPPHPEVADTKKEEIPAEPPKPAHPVWGYEGLLGPENWANFDPSFRLCKEGTEQSPIDLKFNKPQKGGDIEFAYKTTGISIVDNGHTVQVNFEPGNMAKIRGQDYELKNIHFHAQAEHTISKKRHPLEAHLVHQNFKGEFAVIGVFFKPGHENEAIKAIWTRIPKEKEIEKPVTDIRLNPMAFIPPKLTYYTYSGSLTTPPCKEGVNWNVFNTPMELSAEQLNGFTALYPNNYRPTQDLNGRKVLNF